MRRCKAMVPQRMAVTMAAHIVIQRLIEANTSAVNSQRAVEVSDVVRGIVEARSRR